MPRRWPGMGRHRFRGLGGPPVAQMNPLPPDLSTMVHEARQVTEHLAAALASLQAAEMHARVMMDSGGIDGNPLGVLPGQVQSALQAVEHTAAVAAHGIDQLHATDDYVAYFRHAYGCDPIPGMP